jgi:hypothetical protein
MENDKKFPEQEAPEKNTDEAYVKVGEDGQPVMPEDNNTKTGADDNEHVTSLDKR